MVRTREANNPQFSFLRGGNFYKYYANCVAAEQKKLPGRPPSAPSAPVSTQNNLTSTSSSRFSQAPPATAVPPISHGLAQGPSMPGTTSFGNTAEPPAAVMPQLPAFSGLPPHIQHQIQQQMALRFGSPPPLWQSSGNDTHLNLVDQRDNS